MVGHEKLFYETEDGRYLAYWPRDYKGRKTTLQSRNALIGTYTEKWVKDLLEPLAKKLGLYAIQSVVCEEIGLSSRSPADVALVKKSGTVQRAEDIALIVEVKMSIVWNWEYLPNTGELKCIGDFRSHTGNPGLLRSDSMLKAIGKSINIRVSGYNSSKIPIFIFGNTPISESYYHKVDFLKDAGVIQRFISVNPEPVDNKDYRDIKSTPDEGFVRVDNMEELEDFLQQELKIAKEFFSKMLAKKELGNFIEITAQEGTYEAKAEKFLKLLRSS